MKPRAYISGPMQGKPGLNFDTFILWETRLRECGWDVLNPATLGTHDGWTHAQYLDRDIAAMTEFRPHILLMLDGWTNSAGATQEHIHGVTKLSAKPIAAMEADWREWLTACYRSIVDAMQANGELLQKAQQLVTQDRNTAYGPPEQDLERTATVWDAKLRHMLADGRKLTGADVCWLMADLKWSRSMHSLKDDHFADAAGYIACAWQCRVRTET